MSRNLNQIPTAASSILSTDKMYIARSPFGVTDDRYILGSSIISQFGTPLTNKGDIYTFTTVPARLAVGSDGQILQAQSADTTGLSWTTAVYPPSTTINQILYSSADNVIDGLATADNGVLITSGLGVPSISSTLPTAVQDNITAVGIIASGTWNGSGITVGYGGTGTSSFTTYMPICGGTSTTGSLQSVSEAGASAGYVLTYVSNAALPTWQATGAPYTPSALTKTDDTNVTMTLGGTPNTALLQAVSMTLGWTGQLSLARGGTNANLTASAGGIFYSTGSAGAILSGTATASQVLLSGMSAAPSWSTATYPATTTINQLLYSSSANTIAGLATANSSVLITSSGGVPSLSQTLPSAVQGNITTVGTIGTGVWQGSVIALAYGGTNADLTASNGGIVWSNASQMQILSGTATAGQMLQSGSTATPAWSTATWPATTTINQILYSSSNNIVAGLSTLDNGVLITGATGIPALLANGTAGYVLTANTGAPPSWQAITAEGAITTIDGDSGSATPSSGVVTISGGTTGLTTSGSSATLTLGGTLGLANGGTNHNLTASAGGIVWSDASKLNILSGTSTAGQLLLSGNSATPAWTTSTYPSTNAINTLLYASSANTMAALTTADSGVLVTSASGVPSILAAGTTGQVLQASTSGTPAWSTPTYPTGSGSTGVLLRSDGTNYVATTSTYPNTNAINTLLYASAANVMSALTTANSSVLRTDSSGVPSWVTPPIGTITFTYDVSTASGSQSVTGMGFKPKGLILFANINISTSSYTSWGMVASGTGGGGSASGCIFMNTSSAFGDNATNCIELVSGTNTAVATVSSFDSDGFTLSWTKTNSPTGTARIFALGIG